MSTPCISLALSLCLETRVSLQPAVLAGDVAVHLTCLQSSTPMPTVGHLLNFGNCRKQEGGRALENEIQVQS